VVALIGSAMAKTPARAPSTAAKIDVAPSALGLRVQGGGVDALLGHELARAQAHAAAVNPAQDPLADRRIEVHRLDEGELAFGRGAQDGVGQGMLAAALQAGGQP